MGKIFDIFEFVGTIFDWFLSTLSSIWEIVKAIFTILPNALDGCPIVLEAFFSLFLVLAVVMFVWRLIP